MNLILLYSVPFDRRHNNVVVTPEQIETYHYDTVEVPDVSPFMEYIDIPLTSYRLSQDCNYISWTDPSTVLTWAFFATPISTLGNSIRMRLEHDAWGSMLLSVSPTRTAPKVTGTIVRWSAIHPTSMQPIGGQITSVRSSSPIVSDGVSLVAVMTVRDSTGNDQFSDLRHKATYIVSRSVATISDTSMIVSDSDDTMQTAFTRIDVAIKRVTTAEYIWAIDASHTAYKKRKIESVDELYIVPHESGAIVVSDYLSEPDTSGQEGRVFDVCFEISGYRESHIITFPTLTANGRIKRLCNTRQQVQTPEAIETFETTAATTLNIDGKNGVVSMTVVSGGLVTDITQSLKVGTSVSHVETASTNERISDAIKLVSGGASAIGSVASVVANPASAVFAVPAVMSSSSGFVDAVRGVSRWDEKRGSLSGLSQNIVDTIFITSDEGQTYWTGGLSVVEYFLQTASDPYKFGKRYGFPLQPFFVRERSVSNFIALGDDYSYVEFADASISSALNWLPHPWAEAIADMFTSGIRIIAGESIPPI